MNDKLKGPFDFERGSPEVIDTPPLLKVNVQATSADLVAEIGDILGETDAQLVTIGASLDSETGAPEPQVTVTALWAVQRQYALMRCYLAALAKRTMGDQ